MPASVDTHLQRRLREAVGKHTVRRVAERVGVAGSTLDALEKGQLSVFPTPTTIKGVAAALGMTEAEVLLGFGAMLGLDVEASLVHRLPPEADDLPPARQELLLDMIRTFIGSRA